MQKGLSLLLFLGYCTLNQGIFLKPATAQVTPDGTTSTTVSQDGNDFTINQGDRVGDSLFHSFDEFSVPTMGSAEFNNAGDIANIFSRVTGSNISNIDGLISAKGAANLFLINPNGIIFGENTRLNLGGSFFASTADSLLFDNRSEFSASNPQALPLLEVNIPIGLNFRDNPGDIVNQSVVQNSSGDVVGLEVLPGKNLTLVGGNINFEAGNMTAGGGNIELGGLSGAGRVTFNNDGSLSFPEDVERADITLTNNAGVDVTGIGGGSITINARNLNLEAGDFGRILIRAGITADSTSSEAQAGDITIDATENIAIDNSSIANQVNLGAVGNVGGVIINTGSLSLTNSGLISSSTFGLGNAGDIIITATDAISLSGSSDVIEMLGSRIISEVGFIKEVSQVEGNSGDIIIDTRSLSLSGGSRVSASTFAVGNVGAVKINASDFITVDGSLIIGQVGDSSIRSNAMGNSGGITIDTGSLSLTDTGIISVFIYGVGNAGDIIITATDTISLSGESLGGISSSIYTGVDVEGRGNSGGIIIDTGSLSL